jgi:hypothetical protein
MENLDDDDDVGINKAWKSIRETIASVTDSLNYYELK